MEVSGEGSLFVEFLSTMAALVGACEVSEGREVSGMFMA